MDDPNISIITQGEYASEGQDSNRYYSDGANPCIIVVAKMSKPKKYWLFAHVHKGNNVSDLAKAIEELIDGSWETDLDISLITENSSENKKHIKEVKETFESYLDVWIDDKNSIQ